jgi:hypothetical protein
VAIVVRNKDSREEASDDRLPTSLELVSSTAPVFRAE